MTMTAVITTVNCPRCGTEAPIPHIIPGRFEPTRCPHCGLTILIFADLFCGAGGTSSGAVRAVRRLGAEMVLVCINHWHTAIDTHRRNHPRARHHIEDIAVADPVTLVPEGYLDVLMASPECRFYSRARGGRPTQDQGRMNPFQIHNWLTKLEVRCLLVENVTEFVKWGPLNDKGLPDPEFAGLFFTTWLQSIKNLGYQAEYRFLNAADFGGATTRTRFFLIARKDGLPIRWPEPTHSRDGDPDHGIKKWRAAREIINWENPGRSLLDDPKYQKRPLAGTTLRRIARGLEKTCGPLAPYFINLLGIDTDSAKSDTTEPYKETIEPFIINRCGENGSDRVHDIDRPTPTATTRGAGYVVTPMAEPFIMGKQSDPSFRTTEQPLVIITTQDSPHLIRPIIGPFVMGKNGHSPAYRNVDQPIPSPTTESASLFINPQAFVLGQQSCSSPREVDKPIPTICTEGALSLINPTLIKYYSHGDSITSVDDALPAVTTKDRFALITPKAFMVPNRLYNEQKGEAPRFRDINKPVTTITSHGAGNLVEPTAKPFIIKVNEALSRSIDKPIPTLVTKANVSMVNPVLVELNHANGDGRPASVEEPLKTLTTKQGTAIITPFIVQWDQQGSNGSCVRPIDSPLATIITKQNSGLILPVIQAVENGQIDPRRLIFINGVLYFLDILFRMLGNDEMAAAMGFDGLYEFSGNKGEITKQIGNAVHAGLAEALVGSILGDLQN